ncbi:MAG: SCP2 sterol-binding domain-containing protein [Candidatus Bathyarchaeota archaeon]|nr:SCP2 sterol-binding domain-containing protein [Candidatus Bathyarchaeota archaeon]MDH5788534.1 SCP2 sterol-binding domain-containing protein [Candidatus Bathyarchaeota archaeon]
MSLKYESLKFSEELRKRINANKEYREKSKGVNWKTLFVVKDVPFAIISTYVDGEFVERKHVPASEIEETRKKVDFTVEIPTYDLSIEVATGRKSLESLFLSRMLKLEGSIFKAMQYRGAIEAAGKIAAEFVSKSAIPSKEDFMKMLKDRGLL